jgi:glyoxylase-like metal-dependent hydrolase (beta-lactamase superfamily II)
MPEGKARRMWALPGAMVDIPRSMLMLGAEPVPVTIPTSSFLIEHPKGLVLFDSGCNPKILDDPVAYWGPMAAGMPFKWTRQETLDKQIERVGYKTSDVKYVVLSHGHLDHAGGLAYFPEAKLSPAPASCAMPTGLTRIGAGRLSWKISCRPAAFNGSSSDRTRTCSATAR